MEAVEKQKVGEFYREGPGQEILPLPKEQRKDIESGLTTIRKFPDVKHHHIVYKDNPEDFLDGPEYETSTHHNR